MTNFSVSFLRRHIRWVVVGAVVFGGLAAYEMQRCRNVACALSREEDLARRFDKQVPLFLEASSSAALLAASPALAQDANVAPMLEMLGKDVEWVRNAAPASASCAVVGNSQNIKKSGYGPAIDGHDYVFRMNSAPVKSYTADVGSRTTHHIFSHYYSGNYKVRRQIRIRPYDKDTINILIPLHSDPSVPFSETSQTKDYAAFEPFFVNLARGLSSNGETPAPPLTRDDLTQVRDVSHLVVLTPDFLWYANESWFTPPVKKEMDIASTGFITMVLAFHLCDSIDLYGFGPDSKGMWGKYFSTEKDMPVRHQPGYQDELLDMLGRKDVVTIYRGKK